MSKYEVTNPEEKIQLVELIPTHKLNVEHTIYRENSNRYLVTNANVDNKKDYEIDDNIVSVIDFHTDESNGVTNSDLLEIVFDRLNNGGQLTNYEFEALRAIKTALVFLSSQETDDIVALASQMAKKQQQQEKPETTKPKTTKEEKNEEKEDDEFE
jgi:hypothetical protein